MILSNIFKLKANHIKMMQSVIGSKRLETTGILKIKHKTKITTEGITRICNFEKTLSKLRKKNIPLTKYEINAGS